MVMDLQGIIKCNIHFYNYNIRLLSTYNIYIYIICITMHVKCIHTYKYIYIYIYTYWRDPPPSDHPILQLRILFSIHRAAHRAARSPVSRAAKEQPCQPYQNQYIEAHGEDGYPP